MTIVCATNVSATIVRTTNVNVTLCATDCTYLELMRLEFTLSSLTLQLVHITVDLFETLVVSGEDYGCYQATVCRYCYRDIGVVEPGNMIC